MFRVMLRCSILLALPGLAAAQEAGAPIEARVPASVAPRAAPPESGFKFLGLFQTRATVTDVTTTNPFLDGQVVGLLGGTNGTTTSADDRASMVEQRASGFLSYAPPVMDSRVELGAAFEVDFVWGDQSYGSGGNTGGAFGGDQVNLQTRRLYGAFKPTSNLRLVAGLQFVADGAADPASARPDDLFRSGARLMVFGSEAAGVSAYGKVKRGLWERARYRLGAYTLYEESVSAPDDVTLVMGDLGLHPAPATWVTLHAWGLRDNAGGSGGGVFGAGPTSVLAEFQGAAKLDTGGETDADLGWFGADLAYNHDLTKGRLGATALVLAQAGRLYVTDLPDVPVLGAIADGELRWRYAAGEGSTARLEGLFTTGDDTDEARYTGVITGNSYGIVGSVYASHGMVLLFADPTGIDRQVSVVYDVSNQGRGLVAGMAQLGYDLVPNWITAVAGAGHARTAGGETVGTEVNLRLKTKPWLFGNVDLVGATVLGTDLPANPWATYVYVEGLVF